MEDKQIVIDVSKIPEGIDLDKFLYILKALGVDSKIFSVDSEYEECFNHGYIVGKLDGYLTATTEKENGKSTSE